MDLFATRKKLALDLMRIALRAIHELLARSAKEKLASLKPG